MPNNIDSLSKPPSASLYLATPIGTLKIEGNQAAITGISFLEHEPTDINAENPPKVLEKALKQLQTYFSGTNLIFDFPMQPEGTSFQKQVWEELLAVKLGETQSYKALAIQLGNLKAIRAVGKANGKNPIAIAIPCHRIIGHNGTLTGYAGGLWRKEWLLKHEQAMAGKPVQLGLFD